MTLSKEELEFALVCAKSYYYESSESDYPNKSDKDNEIRFRDLENALYADNLEIEGYEKSEWIKFDSNDSKTFPPKGNDQFLTLSNDGEIRSMRFDFDAALVWKYHISHWRPLPNLPVEKKAKNEAE